MSIEEIKITGMDAASSSPGKFNLRIAPQPDNDWIEIFEDEWRNNFYMSKRNVEIYGNRLVVHCQIVEELERGLLDELKRTFAKTNVRYKAFMDEQEAIQREQVRQALEKQEKMKEAASRMNFD